MNALVPERIFLTQGVGVHQEKLASFEVALRDAGIATCNLVYVSSIVPPNCTLLSKEKGLKMLRPGQIVFCVMSRIDTNEPNRLIAASIGMAVANDRNMYVYLSTKHTVTRMRRQGIMLKILRLLCLHQH